MTHPQDLAAAAEAVRRGSTTSRQLTEAALRRADELDSQLGVFVTRFDESALASADRADSDVAAGRPLGPLHGVPLGIKDLLATREGPTTGQSLVIDPEWGAEDATAVARLRAAGAVIVGKTTLLELAYGTHDPSHPFPVPANPWHLSSWPGGSSSGSGSGVAGGMMLGSVGTDTGGSIRVPAAMCGVTGIKPTHGLVPTQGCLPLSWTQDHVGPLASDAEGCRILLEVMSGRAMPDHASTAASTASLPLTGLRVGVDRMARITDGLAAPAVAPLLDAALEVMADLGADLVDLELPLFAEVTDASFLTVATERMAQHRHNLPHRWQDYGRSARLGLARSAYYSAADHVQAQRVRELGRRRVAETFSQVDVVVSPMCSAATPLVTEVDAFMATWKRLVHAAYWDALGNPAISVPMGFDGRGMPLGLQLAGRPFDDAALLRTANVFQAATDWHTRRPDPAAVPANGGTA